MASAEKHEFDTASGHPDQQSTDGSLATRSVQDSGLDAEKQKKGDQQMAAEANPSIYKLLLVGVSLSFVVFLVSLDQTIVANVTPTITDEFQSFSDVGWYGSGYLLTTAAFQLFYGRVYSNFSIKYTFLAAILLFELGSLVCGLAPTSTALIVGRAVSGLGGAGIMSGSMIIIAHEVPPRTRPMFISFVGIMFAVASVLGPLLGGVFTTKLTWRWCFYINLPFGGFTILMIFLIIHPPRRPELESLSITEKIKRIDFIGLLLLVPAIVCLLLALQWGGSTYQWSDGRIIALLTLFGVLTPLFLAFEYWKGAEATLPLRIMAQRSVAAATWNSFCNGAGFLLLMYYIPFWHQAIRGVDAIQSGIDLLPLIIGVVIMSMLSGVLVSKFGYYTVMMLLGSTIGPIGAGLLITWTVDTDSSRWIGYQALAAIGIGLGQQQPIIAVQTVLAKAEVASGTSIIMLVQTLSSAIFVSIGQSVLQNQLIRNLEAALPRGVLDTSSLASVGATQVRSLVPEEYLRTVLVAYNDALTKVFTVSVCMLALSMIGSLAMEWKSVKESKEDSEKEPASDDVNTGMEAESKS